jgi:hypothetical protein
MCNSLNAISCACFFRYVFIALSVIPLLEPRTIAADDTSGELALPESDTPEVVTSIQDDETTDSAACSAESVICIDGDFADWSTLPRYTDPEGDTHDTDKRGVDDEPWPIVHPDVDLLEYSVTHDNEAFYFYMRSKGRIGHTQVAKQLGRRRHRPAGRYYVTVTIDVDQNDETGYSLNEGGYYPTTQGYDTNSELEFYNGRLNVAKYLNHGIQNSNLMGQAFLDQSSGEYRAGKNGPYPAGFMSVGPSVYKDYTEWVYHADDTVTFVHDKGPAVGVGIATNAQSEDLSQIEMRFPFKGFLKDETGKPLIAVGSVVDLSFSLEASGGTDPFRGGWRHHWASDTREPILKYVVTESP